MAVVIVGLLHAVIVVGVVVSVVGVVVLCCCLVAPDSFFVFAARESDVEVFGSPATYIYISPHHRATIVIVLI